MQISPELLEKIKNKQTATPHDPEDVTYLVVYPNQGEPPKDLYEGAIQPISLDKSWNVLHYLLTGIADLNQLIGPDAPPLHKAILGGTEVGKELGYGPAKYLTPNEVKEVSKALSDVSKEDLQRKYDTEIPKVSNDLYPAIGLQNPERWKDPEERNYFLSFLEPLKSYYQDAATKGNAMLLWTD